MKSMHITDDIYESLAEAIKSREGYFSSSWSSPDGSFEVSFTAVVNYNRLYTGVMFLGDRESYLEPKVDYLKIDEFHAYEEDKEIPCDFDKTKIYNYL